MNTFQSMTPARWSLLILSVLLLFAGHHDALLTREASSQEPSETEQSDKDKTKREIRSVFRNVRTSLQEASDKMNRKWFEPDAVVEHAGEKPDKLFSWVQKHTGWIPYRGVLRGAKGVLNDRMGNSLDRALLLEKLLTLSGYETRLAAGTLSKKQARKIWSAQKDQERPAHQDTSESSIKEIAKKVGEITGEPSDQLMSRLMNNQFMDQSRHEDLLQRASWQTQKLLEDVTKKIEPSSDSNTENDIQTARQHWWVQYNTDGSDEWTSLDPATSEMEPGDQLVSPEKTIQPDELPSEVYQKITIHVRAEQLKDGDLNKKTVLKKTVKPARIHPETIQLSHVPMDLPDDFKLLKGENGDEIASHIRSTLMDQNEWLPVVSIGGEQSHQYSVKASGEINKNPVKQSTKGKKVKNASKALGGLQFGGSGGSDKKSNKHLTAEWVEFVIHRPGSEDRTVRREVFDLIGPGRRKSEASDFKMTKRNKLVRAAGFMHQQNILLQNCWYAPQQIQYLRMKNLWENIYPLQQLLLGVMEQGTKKLEERLSLLNDFPANLFSLAVSRRSNQAGKNSLAISEPNILTYYQTLRVNDEGTLMTREGFDIVSNHVETIPGKQENAFQKRLRQGVFDTVTESIILEDQTTEPVINTSRVFQKTRLLGTEWTLVQNSKDLENVSGSLPAHVKQRMSKGLEAGEVYYLPEERPKSFAGGTPDWSWWRIHANRGDTLGMGGRGRGQDVIEKALIDIANALNTAKTIQSNLNSVHDCINKAGQGKDVQCCLMKLKYSAMTGFAGALVGSFAKGVAEPAFSYLSSKVSKAGKDNIPCE